MLQTHIATALNKKQEIILASFDIESAFDNINRQTILNKLMFYNINGNMFKFIENILSLGSLE